VLFEPILDLAGAVPRRAQVRVNPLRHLVGLMAEFTCDRVDRSKQASY
jgi:hypothetical protein